MNYKGNCAICDFIVVGGKGCSILGYKSDCELGILKIIYSLSEKTFKHLVTLIRRQIQYMLSTFVS